MITRGSWLWVSVACTALCGAFGCGDDDADLQHDSGSPDAGPDAGPAAEPVLRVATFNAGLLDTVGYVPERRPLVADALAALDADVLCVQEVWQEEHWDALVAANEDERSEVLRLDAMPGVEGQCSSEEFVPLRACTELMCPDAGPSDLTLCTVEMCPDEVEVLSSSCTTCLLDNGASGDLDVIEAACLGAGGGSDGPLPPEERSYFLGGSFGIGVLSKLPLMETDSLVLDSSTTRRGILYAKIDVPELGEVDVFCTHLTAVLGELRYDGSEGSWEGENEAHVQALIDWVDEKTDAGAKVIVMGDLNTSPAVPADDIEAEAPDSYMHLPEAGFDDPFLDGENAACTFCLENPLVRAEDTGLDATLDHIMTRGIDSEVTASRILTDLVSLGADEDGGAPAELPLSDHYGLEATFFE